MRKIWYLILGIITLSCQENTSKKAIENVVQNYSLKQIDSTKITIDKQMSESNVYKPNMKKTDLIETLNKINSKEQAYTFKLSDDTVIICKEGTKIIIPSDVFEFENGDSLFNKNITLKIEEYYKISEMILGNLTTTSDGNILETGGMIKLTATSENKKLKIKDGKLLTVIMPNSSIKGGMQLFNGIVKDKIINWKSAEQSNSNSIMQEPFWGLNFDQCYMLNEEDFRKKLKYPNEAFKKNQNGSVSVEFVVDKDGVARNPKVIQGVSESCDKEVLSKLLNYKGFVPANVKKNKVCSKNWIFVDFIKAGNWTKIQVSAITKENRNNHREFSVNTSNKKKSKDQLSCPECDKIYDFEMFYNSINTSVYSFQISNLGWINCDKLLKDKNLQLTKLILTNPSDCEIQNFIVLKKMKSIMSGFYKNEQVFFSNVPIGYEAIIISIKEKNEKLFFSRDNITIKPNVIVKFSYNEMTKEMLQEELEKLN